MRILLPLLIACLALFHPQPARAWWEYGHRTVAEIAETNISPRARANLAALFRAERQLGTPKCALKSLGDAAIWPDCLRGDAARWAYTFPWHYQTHNVCKAFDPKGDCANGNCVSAQIDRNLMLLKDRSLPAPIRLEALAFLAHFVGDIHMPLHSGDHDDKGGNDVKANYGIIPGSNLHSVWDGLLADRAISQAPALVRRYDAAERADLGGGTVADWGRESWELSRALVYPSIQNGDPCDAATAPPANPVTFDEADVAASQDALRRRIMQGGLRLARVLEDALG